MNLRQPVTAAAILFVLIPSWGVAQQKCPEDLETNRNGIAVSDILNAVRGGDFVEAVDSMSAIARISRNSAARNQSNLIRTIGCPTGGGVTSVANNRHGVDYTLDACGIGGKKLTGRFSSYTVPGIERGYDNIELETVKTVERQPQTVRLVNAYVYSYSFKGVDARTDKDSRHFFTKQFVKSYRGRQHTIENYSASLTWESRIKGTSNKKVGFFLTDETGTSVRAESISAIRISSDRKEPPNGAIILTKKIDGASGFQLDLSEDWDDALACSGTSQARLMYNTAL